MVIGRRDPAYTANAGICPQSKYMSSAIALVTDWIVFIIELFVLLNIAGCKGFTCMMWLPWHPVGSRSNVPHFPHRCQHPWAKFVTSV